MDTLGKFKTNFLKDKSSFKIGFNNRSPLSNLKGGLDGGIKSASSITIPKLNPTIGKDGSSILVPDNSGQIDAAFEIGSAIGQAGEKIGKAIKEKQTRKKEEKQLEENIKNLPDIYQKWKEDNPADTDGKRFNEKYYDVINEYMKRHGKNNYKNDADKFDKH